MEEERSEEEIELVGDDEGVGVKLAKLKKDLEACRADKDEYLRGWQRAKADFINNQRQREREDAEQARFFEKLAIEDLLDIVDSFENAFALEVPDIPWAVGIRRIYDQCLQILERRKVTAIETKGRKFDPYYHEAVETTQTTDSHLDGTVIEEYRKGYKLGDEVLRPSKVKVARFENK